jgi:hypothetical protein
MSASSMSFTWPRFPKVVQRLLTFDQLGLLLHAIVHPADIQDREGGILLLATL